MQYSVLYNYNNAYELIKSSLIHEWVWEQLNKVNTTIKVLVYLIEVDTKNIISCIVSGH